MKQNQQNKEKRQERDQVISSLDSAAVFFRTFEQRLNNVPQRTPLVPR